MSNGFVGAWRNVHRIEIGGKPTPAGLAVRQPMLMQDNPAALTNVQRSKRSGLSRLAPGDASEKMRIKKGNILSGPTEERRRELWQPDVVSVASAMTMQGFADGHLAGLRSPGVTGTRLSLTAALITLPVPVLASNMRKLRGRAQVASGTLTLAAGNSSTHSGRTVPEVGAGKHDAKPRVLIYA